MALWDEVIKPAPLTIFARSIAERYDGDGLLSDIFPNVSVDDVVFEWEQGERLTEVAEYRAFNAETSIGDTAGKGTRLAKLAPLGRKYEFSEYEKIRYSARNSSETVQAAIERLAATAAKAAVNRVALARGEALATGKLSIHENGFDQEVDFGRRPEFSNATPANPWDGASADPVADIAEWVEAYATVNGEAPDQLIVSRKVAAALTKAVYNGLSGNKPAVFTQADANAILSGNGLPTLTLNDKLFKVGSVVKRVLPEDTAILASTNGAGATPWGRTAEAGDPRYNLPGDVELPGLVVGAYETLDPMTKWVHSNAIALPVLGNPDLTLVAKVLA